jgi:hypothetical protein
MSGQRPPTSARASGKYEKNEGQHPSDDLLLAYVRQQHLDNWIEVEQHSAECPSCQQKCLAYRQDGWLISAWMQEQSKQSYASVVNRVMQQVALESRQSTRERLLGRIRQAYKYSLLEGVVQKVRGQGQGQSQPQSAALDVSPLSPLTDEPLPGPFAELQVRAGGSLRTRATTSRRSRSAIAAVIALAIITVVILVIVSPNILPKRPVSQGHQITVQQQNVTPTPTKQKSSETPTRATPVPSEPQISLCSTQSEIKHYIIRICGSGFTKNGRVWLTIYGPVYTLLPKSADYRGDVDITFNFNSCRSGPILIIVEDASSQRIATLSNISLSSCFSARHR